MADAPHVGTWLLLLGRRRKVRLENGVELLTPLVMPAISTRNVGRIELEGEYGHQQTPVSYGSMFLELLASQLDKALLVSAYDLHYGSLHDSDRLLEGTEGTVFETPNFLMVDSGLYETRERVGYDDGYERPRDWNVEAYSEVLSRLPETLSAAIVNYDLNADQVATPREVSYEAQLDRARQFFAGQPDRFVSVFLLKPEKPRGFIDPRRLTSHAADLKEFGIIAVTEKELGDTLRDRFAHLAELRTLLDRESVTAPIHVFGGLDPLLTPIYISCGAEIVDGVGWLRYAYSADDDTATYLESRPIIEVELDMRVPNRLFRTFTDNLTYLHSLRNRLELLIESGDWSTFSDARGDSLERCVATIFSNLGVT